ncbi:MAG: tRNA (adenosine(37)-N6)-threonylcarbamoyltransferase complex ATPase subunit type 1 TsaE [Archangium sp.]|nr:tRNA (adenosine(37)-N6)-threonylcarbamoyltransferase complex ATPase subunit type 1 TsaE [Archangium sp.]
MRREYHSTTEAQTFELGVRLGALLRPGHFVGLIGQLGAGKTAFSRGVASGAGVPLDDVSSPTYSLVQTYKGRVTLHHLDLYRLATEADLFSIGYFELIDDAAAMLVEWVDRVASATPSDALVVTASAVSETERLFRADATGAVSERLLHAWLPG